jgi:LPXTG-motif cell wall-anchored protein
VLGANIDLGIDFNWMPIGTRCESVDATYENCDSVPFTGTFDGAGFTISNLRIVSTTNRRQNGLFAITNGAVIEDLIFEDVTVNTAWERFSSGGGRTGTVVGQATDTTIADITLTGDISISSANDVGAIAGIIFGTDVSEIDMDDATTTLTIRRGGYGEAGGVIGSMLESDTGGSTLTNVSVDGLLIRFEDVDVTGNRAYFVGGLVGRLIDSSINNAFVRNLSIGGGPYEESVRRYDGAGGAVGLQSRSDVSLVLVEGEITGGPRQDESLGGLVGKMQSGSSLKWSKAAVFVGEVQDSEVGGLVGDTYGEVLIEDSYFEGTVEGFEAAGGLIGRMHTTGWDEGQEQTTVVRRTYARGPVVGTGGLVGDVVYYGEFAPDPDIEASVWDVEQSGQETTADEQAEGLLSAVMKLLDTYTSRSWDIVEGVSTFAGVTEVSVQNGGAIWGICEGETYPFLQWEFEEANDPCDLPDPSIIDLEITEPGGLGTIERPNRQPNPLLDYYYKRVAEEVSELPDTGKSSTALAVVASLLLVVGASLVVGRRRILGRA